MTDNKIKIHVADLPDHVQETMCRILLAAIRREQERNQGKAD